MEVIIMEEEVELEVLDNLFQIQQLEVFQSQLQLIQLQLVLVELLLVAFKEIWVMQDQIQFFQLLHQQVVVMVELLILVASQHPNQEVMEDLVAVVLVQVQIL